jgi:SAM-dependent methyltransferase
MVAGRFTAHNIRLDDGSFTMPELGWQMEDLQLLKFTKQFLRVVFPDGFVGKRIVDLGCLEGGYAVELARAGFDTLGVEVRQSNFENCQLVKAATNLPNLAFTCDDVHNLGNYGMFDATFCCGLLYHLDEPRKFIELMARLSRRVAIIDTHVADAQPNGVFALSDITQNDGLAGRWFGEFEDDDHRHQDKWSAWSNRKSFWVMKRDLIEALRQAGFPMVLEYPIFEPYRESTHRVTIVALKD